MMAGAQHIAIVDPNNDTREGMQSILLGVESVWLEAVCPKYEFFVDVVEQAKPNVAIISLDADTDAAFHLIHSLSVNKPDVDIIAASSRSDGQFILDVMRRGVKEFIRLPVQLEELIVVLERIGKKQQAASPTGARGSNKVFAITGVRGGVGVTSLAVNIGCILAMDKASEVSLVDLDVALGDCDVCLDITPDYTLADVSNSIERIDLQWLKRALAKHASGLSLLPHPVKVEEAALIQGEHITRVVALMKMIYNYVLLDLSKAYQPTDYAAMMAADEVLLVLQLDVSGLHNTIRLLQAFEEIEGLSQKVKLIVNRVGSDGSEISVQKAEDAIGRPIFCQVPNDARTMFASRNNDVPLL